MPRIISCGQSPMSHWPSAISSLRGDSDLRIGPEAQSGSAALLQPTKSTPDLGEQGKLVIGPTTYFYVGHAVGHACPVLAGGQLLGRHQRLKERQQLLFLRPREG